MSGERSRSSSSSSSSSSSDGEEQKDERREGEQPKIDWGKDNAIVWTDGRKKEEESLPTNTVKPTLGLDIGGSDIGDWCMKPVPKNVLIECHIERKRGTLTRAFPSYYLTFDKSMKLGEQFLLCGRRKMGNKTSNYHIFSDPSTTNNKSRHYRGKLKSNFMGTQFVCYDHGCNPTKAKKMTQTVRTELAGIKFGANIGKAHPRDMTVGLPRNNAVEGSKEGTIGVLQKMDQGQKQDVFMLYQKQPQWNERLKAFTLNFRGRVTQASVKNFQLAYRGLDQNNEVTPDQEIMSLQFGKIGENSFTMDVQYPLSIFQAFAICLASFDPKLACEG